MHAVNTEHRDLTLMFTDIVGYSRLMGRDEALTVDMLEQYRDILLFHIQGQGGTLVEFAGDAIFARFETPSAAINAAIAIQQHLLAFNEARDKKLPPLQTRIGLHKGEVMLRENAIFGDSVNVAARLEPLAVPDGICISQSVYDEIRFTLSSPAKPLGNQSLKNIEHKVRAYLIKPSGIGWRDHLHYFLRGLNERIIAYRYPISAAVLAVVIAGFYFIPRWLVPGYTANYVEIADFKNLMNENSEADYFSAGITEAVRSQLADMRDVYIVDAKEGVHAPIRLEGSVQKLGNNLRIAYRLFRRDGNVQIAGGKLDGAYQDIFILQDRLVGEIARYLADEFNLQNFRPAPLTLTSNVTAYDYYLQGIQFLNGPASQENIDKAVQLFNMAIVHDERFSLAFSGLCKASLRMFVLSNISKWLNIAEEQCKIALEKDNFSARAYSAMAMVFREKKQYEEAISWLNKAISLDDNDISIKVSLATTYAFNKEYDAAENIYKRLLAEASKNLLVYEAYGYFLILRGRYLDAIDAYENALEITPENPILLNNLSASYMYVNDFRSAGNILAKASQLDPTAIVFGNTGNMYLYSGDYEKSVDMFKKAIYLEPVNYEWLINLADVYLAMGDKKVADIFYNKTVNAASTEVHQNPDIAKPYCYLARAYAALNNLLDANKLIDISKKLRDESIDCIYARLRISILENNESEIRKSVKDLLAEQYSVNLIYADPTLSVLKEKHFSDLFNH